MGILLTQVGQCYDVFGVGALHPLIHLTFSHSFEKHFFFIKFVETKRLILLLL